MYLLTITKGDRTEEYLIEVNPDEYYIQNIIEYDFIQTVKEAGDFYSDRLEYMKDLKYEIEYLKYPRIWILYTKVRGYDTYDSGVFSAWTENRARELAEKKSTDFKKADIELIGIYNRLAEEEICSSFNAG
jgi:hypothetical protein